MIYVYTVELREGDGDAVVGHVASSYEKALAWATAEEQLEELRTPDHRFMIFEEGLDNPSWAATRWRARVSHTGEVTEG